MYDDYDLDYTFANDYHLDEDTYYEHTHTKRQVRVTLDIECYEDLELDDINWNDVLGLEPNESVNIIIHDIDEFW
jgi:hypothetical protein